VRLAKHIPPRRAIGLGTVLRLGDHFQIVGRVPASARIWHHMVYLVLFGIVALAATFEFGNGSPSIATGDIAGMARAEASTEQNCSDKGNQQRVLLVRVSLRDGVGETAETEERCPVSEALTDNVSSCSDRGENHQAEHDQQENSSVLIHSAAALYTLSGEVSTA
jgi:hypothetical protein